MAKWKITRLIVLPTFEGNQNVVKDVGIEVLADDDTLLAKQLVGIDYKNTNTKFINFDDLSEQTIIQWVKQSLGDEAVQRMEQTQTEEQLPVEIGLPWIREV